MDILPEFVENMEINTKSQFLFTVLFTVLFSVDNPALCDLLLYRCLINTLNNNNNNNNSPKKTASSYPI